MVLHVQLLGGGSFRITTEQPDRESDVLAWLWQADPPAGTEVRLVDQQLGYNKFDATGIHQEESTQLKPDAMEWLLKADSNSYEDALAIRDQEKKNNDAYLNSAVPHLGGVTFKEVWDNWDTWKGLRESDGWFVWVGLDSAYYPNPSVIEEWELPTDESVRRDIRWYVDQGNTLNEAVRSVEKDQFDALKMLIIGIAGAGAGGAP